MIAEAVAASPLLAGLLATAGVLVVLFFVGLSILAPHSPGRQVTLTTATELIANGGVTKATLRDQDARLELRAASPNGATPFRADRRALRDTAG